MNPADSTHTGADAQGGYTLRRSERARRVSLVLTPAGLEVVAPLDASEARIAAFLTAKRRWLHNHRARLAERSERTEAERQAFADPERWVSGAKVPFRGRRLALRVKSGPVATPELRYATAFLVTVPEATPLAEREATAERLVKTWLRQRARRDVQAFVDEHAGSLGCQPRAIRVRELSNRWGSCGPDGTLSLHWRLIAAPRPVLEYVVVHELCHLRERHHGHGFWRLVASLLPDYPNRKAWLDRHGVALG